MRTEPGRIKGTLLGLAAGDKIGGPIQMALTLGESLAACRGFDPEDLGKRYLAWWHQSGFDTGPTAAGVFQLVEKGKSYREAAELMHHQLEGMTAGCNPLHRCPPLALSPNILAADLKQVSKEEARLTHFHPLAGEGSGLVTSIIRNLIIGKSWEEGIMLATRGQPDWILKMVSSIVPPTSRGGYTLDVLKATLYFLHNADSFQDALQQSFDFAGPANYCPVAVGALAGARWGAGSVDPSSYRQNQEHVPGIDSLAERLSQLWKEVQL